LQTLHFVSVTTIGLRPPKVKVLAVTTELSLTQKERPLHNRRKDKKESEKKERKPD
tara:strand:+ start:8897 stop:9064 length:168 start_codon:yes stop_codon:yes gene_type:complete